MSKKKYSAAAVALRSNAIESLVRTTGSRGRVTLSAIYAVAPGEEARSGGPCKIQYSLDDATSPRGFGRRRVTASFTVMPKWISTVLNIKQH